MFLTYILNLPQGILTNLVLLGLPWVGGSAISRWGIPFQSQEDGGGLNLYRPAQSVHPLDETQNSWARGLQAVSTRSLQADAEARERRAPKSPRIQAGGGASHFLAGGAEAMP